MSGPRRRTVLITQGGMKHSLAIIRYLARQGYEVHSLVPPSRDNLAGLSRHTACTYAVDERTEESFISQLRALLRRRSFDVFIPVGYPVTEFTARHADELGKFMRFMSPGRIACEAAGDKLRMSQLAGSLNIPVPRTYQVKEMTDLHALGNELQFPIVVKGRHESGKGIVAYAADSSVLRQTFEEMCHRHHLDSPEDYPILQEYVPGWGCGFFALYQRGDLKRVFMHKRIREYPASGGASSCAESFYDDDLMALGKRLLDDMGWHGVAMVEFRFDVRKRRFTLIEVNAKFWGSLELALRAGADFVGDYVRGAMGEKLAFARSYKRIRFQWPFDGDLLHAVENPVARWAVIRDFLNPFVAKGFHWTDPLPTLAKAYGFTRAMTGSVGTTAKRKHL